MGQLVEAHCLCGYRSDLLAFGAGMATFTTSCSAPASCPNCQAVVDLDYLAADRGCPRCGGPVSWYVTPASTPTMSPTETDPRWRLPDGQELVLPEQSNICSVAAA
jgi:hypothetical protein